MLCSRRSALSIFRLARGLATAAETPAAVGQLRTEGENRTSRRTDNDRGDRRNSRTRDSRRRIASAQPPQSLPELLSIMTTLKAEGSKPTSAAFLALVRAAADYAGSRGNNRVDDKQNSLGLEIALGAIRDAKVMGIELGDEVLDQLYRFTHIQPAILPSLLIETINRGKPTAAAYTALVQHSIGAGRLEELAILLTEMMEQSIVPDRAAIRHFVQLACESGVPRLALTLVEKYESMPNTPKVEASAWVQILAASADRQFVDGVDIAWARVVENKAYTPDEGLILAILGMAGRRGRTDLAANALALLPEIHVKAQEHHLAPLLEAFCREGRVPEALKLVNTIRTTGVEPSMWTVQPIVSVMSDAEILDQAFYTLEDMAKEGTTIDVAALNAVIKGAEVLKDLERARATQLAAADLGVTPNVDTFNIMLDACVHARHRDLGNMILKEMSAAGIEPSEQTYIALIRLNLTQKDYEDAFYYLEKMKAAGSKPSKQLYTQLGRKCANSKDARWKLVAEEMAAVGYKVPDFSEDAEARRRDRGNGRGEREDRRQNSGRQGRQQGQAREETE